MEQVGICDEVIMNENEINFMVNKIGGLPVRELIFLIIT